MNEVNKLSNRLKQILCGYRESGARSVTKEQLRVADEAIVSEVQALEAKVLRVSDALRKSNSKLDKQEGHTPWGVWYE